MRSLQWLACLALLMLAACQQGEYPAPVLGSTYRITDDEPAQGSELRIDVLTTWNECANANISNMEACLPQVDRANAEVSLAFYLRDPVSGAPAYRSLDREQVRVSHNGSVVEDIELVPYDPVSGGQLFILIIDGSGSMYENNNDRINKVYQALMSESVIRAFYPDNLGRTGVVLLRFVGKELKGLDGKAPEVLNTAAEYRKMIKEHLLQRHGGYTHLYHAARFAVTDLLADENIDSFLAIKGAEPTIVLLTDGFNNEAAGEVCKDNVARLSETLDVIREARRVGASARATLYTVGLGRPYRPGNKPDGFNQAVSPESLCGRYADYKIDPDLETAGIDHVSLQWLAEAGGGLAFTRRDPRGLAEVFQKAASARYRWYQLKYRLADNFHHRRAFRVRVALDSVARAYTELSLLPSPWMDAPPGRREAGAVWTTPTSLWSSLVLVMPVLGALVFLAFLGPAWFNARRAIFRRAKPRKKQGG